MNKNDPIFPLSNPKNEKQDFIGFKNTGRGWVVSDRMKHILRVFWVASKTFQAAKCDLLEFLALIRGLFFLYANKSLQCRYIR